MSKDNCIQSRKYSKNAEHNKKKYEHGGFTIHVEGSRPHIMAQQRKQKQGNNISLTKDKWSSNLTVDECGLIVALADPWLAASPGGFVHDPSHTDHTLGLVKITNPFSVQGKTFSSCYCKIHDAVA